MAFGSAFRLLPTSLVCIRTRRDQSTVPVTRHARLVLMCGPPGSGKTTVARLLVKQLRAISLSPDEWMTQLGVSMDHPLREPIGELQWTLAQELLVNGQSVILESGHWMRSERDEKRLAARALGVRVEVQYLDVPRDELHRRVDRRTAESTWGAYPMGPEELDRWTSFFEPPSADELALFDPPTVVLFFPSTSAVPLSAHRGPWPEPADLEADSLDRGLRH